MQHPIFFLRCSPVRVMVSSFLRFLDHTQWSITAGRTPLDKWSVRRRDLYLTTHNTHNRQKSMPPVGFKPTISEGERSQTYTLDRAATGTGRIQWIILKNVCSLGEPMPTYFDSCYEAWIDVFFLSTFPFNFHKVSSRKHYLVQEYKNNSDIFWCI